MIFTKKVKKKIKNKNNKDQIRKYITNPKN